MAPSIAGVMGNADMIAGNQTQSSPRTECVLLTWELWLYPYVLELAAVKIIPWEGALGTASGGSGSPPCSPWRIGSRPP